jgi:hypothetical protein
MFAVIGDVVGLCEAVENHCCCKESGENVALVTLCKEVGNKHAAHHAGAVDAIPVDQQRIEGLDGIESVFFIKKLGELNAKACIIALELDAKRSGGVNARKNVLKKRNSFVCALDLHPGKLRSGLRIDALGAVTHALKGVIVEDYDLIVLRKANVKLNAVALALCGVECLHCVFHSEIAVQSAVSIVDLEGLNRGLGFGTGTEKEDVER